MNSFLETLADSLDLSQTNLVIIFIALAIFYFWYVTLASRRNKVQEALSGVDVQLKKRYDLIPNILKIAKKFMEHESELFSQVVKLREKISEDYNKNDSSAVQEYLKNSAALSSSMGSFIAKMENYPELKSSQNMLQAQQSYNEVEAEIAAARRFYNSAINSLRNAMIFPGNIIALITRIKTMPFYEAEESAKAEIDAAKFL
jgi:LemA protein